MQAVGFSQHLPVDDPASFEDVQIAAPELQAHDLLVKVAGVSVNPVDTKTRGNGRKNKLAHPKVIGWDAVGIVVAVGQDTELFNVGDRVWYAGDFRRSGSYAQYQAVDERIVGHAPKAFTDDQAAAMPLVGLTAYEALFEQLALQPANDTGKTILIINGAGGVGSMAVQLAKLAGLKVIATASRPDSQAWAQKMGADAIINHHEDLVPQVHELGLKYVDYILNLGNLDAHWDEIAELICPDGRIAATTENRRLIDLQKLTKKRATFSWEWVYSKSYFQTEAMITQHENLDTLAELVDAGKIQPIDKIHYQPINAQNMRKAHADVESGKMVGKVVLTGWPEV
ncbi:zinc-binding alcohol dehydrogenase family protein [Weissella uvarum]|uniref:zinc-binding alcohol dehydrogenase family protein n=1 Tax=Weissella uvarum TaxID=1479233 RepID=UPI001960F9BC|nr:zinc-binding alcohol dehydrogenase family protein [Weissella uvarum]MCM0595975.1 zinc-binding alcohol dehydrogenase family protein [Weissella uvarum]